MAQYQAPLNTSLEHIDDAKDKLEAYGGYLLPILCALHAEYFFWSLSPNVLFCRDCFEMMFLLFRMLLFLLLL